MNNLAVAVTVAAVHPTERLCFHCLQIALLLNNLLINVFRSVNFKLLFLEI